MALHCTATALRSLTMKLMFAESARTFNDPVSEIRKEQFDGTLP
jgi:hypothetical protein